jgi:uncharacterized protein
MEFILFLLAAALYASVGHGGASAYLLVMVLLGFAPETLRPTALTLNILVSGFATFSFAKNGHFPKGLFLPLILASVPCAALAARIDLSPALFHPLLAFSLVIAAIRLCIPAGKSGLPCEKPKTIALLATGAIIGALSGLLGIGGGILLTPLLIFFRWTPVKSAAALTAPFVLLNSISGLVGLGWERYTPSPNLPFLIIAVLLGGALGAWYGSRHATPQPLRLILGAVLCVAAAKLVL